MRVLRAIGFTYEDFREMAKEKSPDAVDFSSYDNRISSHFIVEILYPIDAFKWMKMDFIDLVKEMHPELNLSDNAYYVESNSGTGDFVMVIDFIE